MIKIERIPPFFAGIIESGVMTTGDVKIMQRMIYANGVADRSAALWLLAVRSATRTIDRSFHGLFVEALCDFFVYREGVSGVVTDEQAALLLEALEVETAAPSVMAIDLLEAIAGEATRCSPILTGFLAERMAPLEPTLPVGGIVIDAAERFALAG